MIDQLFTDPAGSLQKLVLKTPALLLAVTVHEVAHGFIADRLGDPTARRLGRLTLNPLPHIDPLGALAFVIANFGWAKPVPVDARHFRRPLRDMACVAAAGPLSNFVVAFLGLMAANLLSPLMLPPFLAEPLTGVLSYIYWFNLALGIFNLIPLPPLDGGHFLPYFLPAGAWPLLRRLQQYGPIILILLVVSGVTQYIVYPVLAVMDTLYKTLLMNLFRAFL